MATKTPGHNRNKNWRARVKESGREYFLGYFATQEEALAVERQFKGSEPQKPSPTISGERRNYGT